MSPQSSSPNKNNCNNMDLVRLASPTERIHFSKDINVLETVDKHKKKLVKHSRATTKEEFVCSNKSFLVLPRYMAL